MRIKICGIKRKKDIDYVNILKPDFVGFVFTKSKNQIDLIEAKELITLLDKNIQKVGVFINKPIMDVVKIAKCLKLDVIQLHGGEDKYYIRGIRSLLDKQNIEIWKAIFISNEKDIEKINICIADKVLLDSGNGGTGISFEWNILRNTSTSKPIILAGGLNSENVEDAIKIVRPYAVDVSSGVKIDGYNNFDKMKEFINTCMNVMGG